MDHLIEEVCARVRTLLAPEQIIVFNVKTSGAAVTSFKLCAVCADCDPVDAEHDIYMNIDCDVPFDALVYTKKQWQAQLVNAFSFASRIDKMGQRYE